MDRKMMILLYFVIFEFTSLGAKAARSPVELAPDDEDYDDGSGEEFDDRHGMAFLSIDDQLVESEEIGLNLDPQTGGGFSDDCAAFTFMGVICPETSPSTSKNAASETTIVHETTTKLTTSATIKNPSNDSSDERHSNSSLPETSTVGNSITQPVKRHSSAKIDLTRVTLMAQTTSNDAITPIATRRSPTPPSGSFTSPPSLSQRSSVLTTQAITKTSTNLLGNASTTSTLGKVREVSTTPQLIVSHYSGHSASTPDETIDTITTPISFISDNAHSFATTKKDADIPITLPMTVPDNAQPTSETAKTTKTLTTSRVVVPVHSPSISVIDKDAGTTPLVIESGDTHSALTTEKNREMSTSSPVTETSDDSGSVTIVPRGSVVEPSTTSKSPNGRKAYPSKGKPHPPATPRILTTESALHFDSTKFAVTDNSGKTSTSTSAELRTTFQSKRTEDMFKAKHGTNPAGRPAQHHDTETIRYAHTTEPDFDIEAEKMSATPQSIPSPVSSTLKAKAAGGSTLLNVILTATTMPPSETPPKKTPASGGNEVLLASTAFPTTIVIICVVAGVIALVIIIVLVVICRGRMSKSGKYNISSEMNSVVGDESGDAKVVKVHYNNTNA